MSDRFDEVGYGAVPVGFGERPAILTVDFQYGFTNPAFPMGKSPHIHRAVANTARLLAKAREQGLPVAHCNVAWGSRRDMGYWKVSLLYSGMFHGDPATQIDPAILDPAYDFTFTKSAPSIFFGTPLMGFLTKQCVDTVVICGCTTSGCVRASIVDAFSHGLRVIVPEDCVGDMEEGPHWDNLRDVGRRYADVVKLEQVMAQLAAPAASKAQ